MAGKQSRSFWDGYKDRGRQNRYEDAGFQQKSFLKPWNVFTTPKHYRPPKDGHDRTDYAAGWKKRGFKS